MFVYCLSLSCQALPAVMQLPGNPRGTGLARRLPFGSSVGNHHCEEGFRMNTGDTAFLLLSAALVMLMTPGLALFYGGMVRRKNILGTIMQSFIILGLISLEWVLVGYSMA